MSWDISERMQQFLLSNEKESRVAFGTTLDRELLPLKTPHTRAGNELGLRGVPNLGPGSYDNAEVSSFFHILNQRPVCKKGYALGARTAQRFSKHSSNTDVPGPPTHQRIISQPREFSPSKKPFGCGATRLPKIRDEATPGPGSFEHGVVRNRKIQFHGSFGGPQVLRTSITTICKNGVKDTCVICAKEPVGDYYMNPKGVAMCRPCHGDLELQKKDKKYLDRFMKVRDCVDVHSHEGTNAKLRLKNERDIKKLKLREAYLSLYY